MALEIDWVPGRISVEGNGRGAEMVKETVEKVGTRRCLERFALLAHVGHTISESK